MQNREPQIREKDIGPLPFPSLWYVFERSLNDAENVERTDNKQSKRVTIHSILQPIPATRLGIFRDGHHPDFAPSTSTV